MKNWIQLSEQEEKKFWKRIYKEFKFKPSTSRFPSFKVPSPFITYDISNFFGETADLELYDRIENKALNAFKNITLVDEYILALDWQHECYWVNPHLEFKKDKFGEWVVPVVPNGDYYFFIQKDFQWGFLGHPWEKSITIFGEDFIKSFNEQQPKIMCNILRQG
ncbi:DUF2716 domain-containing protein [Priestia megaterium]|uniref:DUF2716 domain-containing protein n=1 Tax=Priestia megaterium TaxID=1404 RepID=UPI0035DEDB1A